MKRNRSMFKRLLKTLSESFDMAQDERRDFKSLIISVHAEVLEAFRSLFQQPVKVQRLTEERP
jgi:hypothetical protein